LVDSGRVTIYCPDAIDLDSFYNKSIHPADRMRTHNAFERVIVDGVFDYARRQGSCARVAVCGASLGAYHAANIAFRHPDAVSHLISLSGAFEISDFFDGYHDENIYFNGPYPIPAEHLRSVEMQSHGHHHRRANGITRVTNRIVHDILDSKGIRHWLKRPKWWGTIGVLAHMLPYYLSTI
jgi:esterase/lipase superfamily enzyme